MPEEAAKHFPADQVDGDGTYATMCAWICAIGYNTRLVKPEEAPKGFVDLVDPRWKGRLVKGHPGYSGMITTVTFLMVREFGWSYFEKLAQQRVLQLQSASDPPKKLDWSCLAISDAKLLGSIQSPKWRSGLVMAG